MDNESLRGAPEITPTMVENTARCLRAYLPELSFGESENLAFRALRAGFFWIFARRQYLLLAKQSCCLVATNNDVPFWL